MLGDVYKVQGFTDCFGVVKDLGVVTVLLGDIADLLGDIKLGVVTDLGVVTVLLGTIADLLADIDFGVVTDL